MHGIKFTVKSAWGHFKRPETSDNPCTYSFMHKVALVGFMGAVLGVRRKDLYGLYPQFCDDLLYSIRLLNPVIKDYHSFTSRKVIEETALQKGRGVYEYLKNPYFEITLALSNDRSKDFFESFVTAIKKGQSVFGPYLGVISCPADIEIIKDVDVSEEHKGEFETDAVITTKHKLLKDSDDLNLVFEQIPTHASGGYYTPERRVQVMFTMDNVSIKVNGPYRKIDNGVSAWLM